MIDQVAAEGLEARKGAFLVGPDQPAETGDMGRQDRHQLSFDCLCRHGATSPSQYISTAAGHSNPPGAAAIGAMIPDASPALQAHASSATHRQLDKSKTAALR
jgi:hypothetical protein